MPCFEKQDSLRTSMTWGSEVVEDSTTTVDSEFVRFSHPTEEQQMPEVEGLGRKLSSVSFQKLQRSVSLKGLMKPTLVEQKPADPTPCTGAFILGTGFASAKQKYTTEEMLEAFHHSQQEQKQGGGGVDRDFADRVFRGCGFDTHSVALPKDKLFVRFTREQYLAHRRTALTGLAQEACQQALANWGGNPKEITHLFWGTMTGAMDSPTVDIRLASALGLDLDVKRTSIEGMGCLTGYRLLNLAREVVLGNPKARILVVAADLRSALQNSMPKELSRADIVSLALFRDAGSAVVIGGNPCPIKEKPLYEVMAGKSRIVPNTFNIVDYHEMDDGGIRLNISIELREIVAREEPAFVEDLLKEAKQWQYLRDGVQEQLPEIPEWDIALHTGGPKIIEGVCQAFRSTKDRFQASWKVMKENGNLSGASNLAVLHHQAHLKESRPWVLCLSMGPGVCLEGLVLRRC